MILRLLLFFSLSSIGSSFKPEIELDRCLSDTACYVRESCLNRTQATVETKFVRYKNELLKDDTCDVILQVQPYNAFRFHMMLQVNITTGIISDEGVALKQGKDDQFRCRSGRETTDNQLLDITPYGERRSVLPNFIFCSIIMTMKDKAAPILPQFAATVHIAEIVFTTDQAYAIQFKQQNLWIDLLNAQTCDPDIIDALSGSNDTYFFEKIDNTRAPIFCPSSESLQVKRSNGDNEYPEKLECNTQKMWQFVKLNGENIIIGLINGVQERITVSCAVKKCSLCKPLEDVTCVGCTKVVYNNISNACTSSTCDNGLWRISEGGGDPVEGEMKCDHKMGSQNQKESVWYFTPKGKDPVEISKAACAIDAVCMHSNPDDATRKTRLDCPKRNGESLNCGLVQPEGTQPEEKKNLYCRSGYQLRYEYNEKITDATNITCSAITGKYSDDSNNILPDGSVIFCELITSVVSTTTEIVSVAAASSFPMGAVIGGTVGLIIVIAVAGGFVFFYFSLRRKRKEIEDNEVAIKEDFILRAKVANEAANPNPEKEVYRRIVPDSLKSPWELREYKWIRKEHIYITNEEWDEKFHYWNNSDFLCVIAPKFMNSNKEARQKILRYLTAFNEYAIGERKETQKNKGKTRAPEQFGNLKQFMYLWFHCRTRMFDCACCWEYMFRFMRLLYETFVPYDDHREICKVMLKSVVQVARPWLNELTYKQRTWEESTDTLLRPLAIRMLLWAEAPDVIAEMKRMADLPILDLQVSIRPVVLQYAARNLGRAEKMKTQYWALVEGGTEMNKLDPFEQIAGSLRQHLLFAICSARDETAKGTSKEYKILREMMKIIFNYSKMDHTTTSYTPADQWWAIRGATDSVAGFKPVLDMFIEFAPKNLDEIYEKHVEHTVNFDLEKKKPVKTEWRHHVRRLYNLLAELCTNKSKFNDLVTVVTPMAAWVKQDEKHIQFHVDELGERALNFGNLFTRKDVADVFYSAFIETQHERIAVDQKDGDIHETRLRRVGLNWSARHSSHEKDDD